MGTLTNILKFIEERKLSNREFEQQTGLSNGTLNNALRNKAEISQSNIEKILEKYSTELNQAGYHVITFGPALNGMKVILTADERRELENTARINIANADDQEDFSRKLPIGDINLTVKDYIDKVEQHNSFLQYIIQNGIIELGANLTTGQKQLGEQLFVVGDGLRQQLEGIASGLAARDRNAEKDKGVSGQKGNIHGKNKDL